MVHAGLSVMLMQPIFVLEDPSTLTTIVMKVIVVILQVIFSVKVLVAILAVVMKRALYPVFLATVLTLEVPIALVTDPMSMGVAFMLI